MKVYQLLTCLFLLSQFSCSYLPVENSFDEGLLIEEKADFILLQSIVPDFSKAGLIFYPGGLVDPHAYIKAFEEIVLEEDRMVIIMKAPANLAILSTEKASGVLDEFTAPSRWVVGGHSLGGSVACIDISKNLDSFAGLFLFASYSVDDLSEVDFPVISITGSEDQVLDQEKFNENKVNLPDDMTIVSLDEIPIDGTLGNTIYYEIQGGNHGQFGTYGQQEGDGTASITTDEQQGIVTETLRIFLEANML